ncbi:hypothetical protein FKM82_020380 [Ascaphus truei]
MESVDAERCSPDTWGLAHMVMVTAELLVVGSCVGSAAGTGGTQGHTAVCCDEQVMGAKYLVAVSLLFNPIFHPQTTWCSTACDSLCPFPLRAAVLTPHPSSEQHLYPREGTSILPSMGKQVPGCACGIWMRGGACRGVPPCFTDKQQRG